MPATRVAVVVGASRGIGAQIALSLADNGFQVAVSARKVESSSTSVARQGNKGLVSPDSSLSDVVAAIETRGHKAKAYRCDVTVPEDVDTFLGSVLRDWGRIDVVVYNAGAIYWANVKDTPFKRFDLMNRVNAVGLYKVVDKVLPHFNERKSGRFVVISPPIYSRFFRGKTAYAMGKVAMTVLTHGLALELADDVAITSLWPATAIQSAVTEVKSIPSGYLRTAEIFGDAVVGICNEPASKVNGLALVDEDYLREFRGMVDFSKYRVDPNVEPNRMLPKRFPSLLVEEQDDRGFSVSESSKL